MLPACTNSHGRKFYPGPASVFWQTGEGSTQDGSSGHDNDATQHKSQDETLLHLQVLRLLRDVNTGSSSHSRIGVHKSGGYVKVKIIQGNVLKSKFGHQLEDPCSARPLHHDPEYVTHAKSEVHINNYQQQLELSTRIDEMKQNNETGMGDEEGPSKTVSIEIDQKILFEHKVSFVK
ncbi:hypothetical protein M8J77_012138 [Diaphorina citri]|nr:hypothetical protein M8J77_012138 [Diaphorina citri]